MTTLKEQLQADLTAAMRAARPGAGRHAADGPHRRHQRGGRGHEAPRADATTTCSRCSPRRPRSAARPPTAYTGAGRAELADKEEAELAVLEAYLPEQLGDDELDGLVREAVAATGATVCRRWAWS